MAKASPGLISFNAGEWSSRLEGRYDLAKYPNACRRLRNFLPSVQGPAIKRSGTRYVKDVKDHADVTRLIPFEFGTTQAYVLEFGDGYCRVYMDSGGVLESPGIAVTVIAASTPIVVTAVAHGFANGDQVFLDGVTVAGVDQGYFHIANVAANTFELVGTASLGAGGAGGTASRVYEFSTDPSSGTGAYASADVGDIQYAQSADVLYLACPGYPPRKLSRTGHAAWTIEDLAFDAPPFSQENLDEDDYMIATAATGSVSLYSTGGHFTAGHVGGYVKLSEVIEGTYPEWIARDNPITEVAGSTIIGYRPETEVFGAGVANSLVHYQGRLYRVRAQYGNGRCGSVPPLHETGTQMDGQWDWEFINPGYGWALITAVTDAYFATATVVREFGRTVHDATEAISGITNATPPVVTTTANDWDDGDFVFIYGSGVAAFNNQVFEINQLSTTTFQLVGQVASGVGGAGGIAIRVKTDESGSAVSHPLRTEARKWALGAFSDERGFPSTVAFFEDRLLWAGTESDPQGVWLSRTGRYEDHMYTDQDDGALFLLLNTQQVNRIEWVSSGRRLAIGTAGGEFVIEAAPDGPITAGNAVARQQTYFGSRASVAPVRIESVTVFVQRSGRKLIEFGYDDATQNYQGADLCVLAHHLAIPKIQGMAWAQEPDRVLWVYFEDGSLAGLTYDRSQEVVGWHPHTIGGTSVSVESIAVIPHPDGDRSQVWFVVKRTVNGSVVRHVEYLEETWIQGNAIEDGLFVDAGLTYDGAPTVTVTGLWHLLNTAVRVLADGVEIEGGATVSATTGELELASEASVVQVGLAYDAELEPMLLEAGGADGTAQGKTKRAPSIVFRLEDTGDGFTYGIAEDELAITPGTLITDDTEILAWPDGYTKRQRLPIKHAGPTPCTLVAMFPQVKTEDR